MTLRALVTRPEEDAAPLAAALAERGIQVTAEPLLSIRPVADAVIDLSGVQALLFTSANGVRAFAGLSTVRDLPVFAVGDATAATARDHGFAQVESASGDVTALARLAASRLDPAAGALFHAAGSAVAGDLAGLLEQAGFTLRREMLYEAKPAEQLSPTTVAKLANGELDLVLFFSPRTAGTFVTLARAAGDGVVRGCGKTIAVCLSPAVAAAAGELAWRDLRVASRPELPALLDLIDAELAAQAHNVGGADAGMTQSHKNAEGAPGRPEPERVDMGAPSSRRTRSVWWRVAAGAAIVSLVVAGADYGVRLMLGRAVDVSAEPSWTQWTQDAERRFRELDSRIDTVAADLQPMRAFSDNLKGDLIDARNRIIALEDAGKESPGAAAVLSERLDAAEKAIASLEIAAKSAPQSAGSAEMSALADRIAALEARVAAQPESAAADTVGVDSAALGRLAAENAALRQQVAALAAQIESFKGVGERLDALDRAVAARPGDGGATLVLAVSNLGAALSTARPFAAELGAVTQIASTDPALAAKVGELTAPIASHAAAGIPTLADLRARFDDTARAIVDAAQTVARPPAEPQDKDWLGRQIDWLSSVADYVLSDVSVRPVGDVPGDGPGERVARAEVRLAENALGAAVAELEGLTGPAADAAASWLADARARSAVDEAMAGLQAAVIARAQSGG